MDPGTRITSLLPFRMTAGRAALASVPVCRSSVCYVLMISFGRQTRHLSDKRVIYCMLKFQMLRSESTVTNDSCQDSVSMWRGCRWFRFGSCIVFNNSLTVEAFSRQMSARENCSYLRRHAEDAGLDVVSGSSRLFFGWMVWCWDWLQKNRLWLHCCYFHFMTLLGVSELNRIC